MNGVSTIDCNVPRATHVAPSGAAGVVDSRYLFRKGPNGNYLFRLWAYPGKPLGHSVTITGSKPIGANELPRSDRPWSSFLRCVLQQTLLHHRHAPRRDNHSVPDSSCRDNQFTRPTYYHARYDDGGRLNQRDYRTRANSPKGAIADSDTFTKERGRVIFIVLATGQRHWPF